jgi:hypothetical protein
VVAKEVGEAGLRGEKSCFVGAGFQTLPPNYEGAAGGRGLDQGVGRWHGWQRPLGRPLAATESIEKFLSKPDGRDPDGLFSLGNLSSEVRAKPLTASNEFPGGKRPFGHKK